MKINPKRPLFHENDEINQYTIIKFIQQGGYGETYKVYDNQEFRNLSMKIEKLDAQNPSLEKEIEINKVLNSRSFPQFIDSGQTDTCRYLVQELCGPSFSQIRKVMRKKHFSLSTVLHIGLEMLKVIQKFHQNGFIHCDIKPGNFLLRPSRKEPVVLIDFGLSQRIYDPTSLAEPPSSGFVGTMKYASINAHKNRELSRRDDLYSWFYSLIEMGTGHLPWSNTMSHSEAINVKTMISLTELTKGFPSQMKSIYKIIHKLHLDEEPNYELIMSFLVDAMKLNTFRIDAPFEWESYNLGPISLIPLRYNNLEKAQIPQDLPKPALPWSEIDVEHKINAD